MSTSSERSEIAVLQSEMKGVKDTLQRIESKLDVQNQALVPRTEFDAFKKSVKLNYILMVIVSAVITAMAYALIVGKTK